MVDNSARSGTGTQQFGAGGTSTGGGDATQNLPSGGPSGSEESELQKLRREKEKLSDNLGQLMSDKVAAETRVTVLEKALVDLEAVFAKQKKGLEDCIRLLKDEVGDLHIRLCAVLSAGGGASAAAQLNIMRVELARMLAAKEAAEAEATDLRAKFEAATREVVTMKKVAEGLEKELGGALSRLSHAEARIMRMQGGWFGWLARRRDVEVA